MTRLSRAQQVFKNNILKFDKQETIDMLDLKNSLLERGIHFEQEEIEHLFNSLKFDDNDTGVISRLEIYAKAHLFRLDNSLRTDLMQKIAIGCGVGLTEDDL
jgi:Ca2+-binding EF-hand superfamily protein